MNTEFPKSSSSTYLSAKDFQDTTKTLTYLGWERKANIDRMKDGKVTKSWVDCLDYCLKYSYPEMATDKAGRPVCDEAGVPMRNRNWMPEYPQGYSIVYKFEEGDLESGSSPLFNAFKRLQPVSGEQITIKRTGQLLETKWFVGRPSKEVPSLDVDEFGATTTLPF
jgi:hypothetical protein